MDIDDHDPFLLGEMLLQAGDHGLSGPAGFGVSIKQAVGMGALSAQHGGHVGNGTMLLLILGKRSRCVRIIQSFGDKGVMKKVIFGVAAQAAIEIHVVAVEVNVALGSASHPGKAKGIVGMHQHHAMSREQIAQVGRLQKTELAG